MRTFTDLIKDQLTSINSYGNTTNNSKNTCNPCTTILSMDADRNDLQEI